MAIITLITEWNPEDYYTGAVKGALLGSVKDVKIVDISHQVSKINLTQSAFILKNCYKYFPADTIHLIAVRSEATPENPYIAIYNEKQYFVGTDNGIFGLIFENKPEKIIRIDPDASIPEIRSSSFPELTVLAAAAGYLSGGGKIQDLGPEKESLYRTVPMLPAIEDSAIIGSVIFIDSYLNAITNVDRALFDRIGKSRPFEIYIQNNYYSVNKINKNYGETSDGEILAIFNSLDLLEISIRNGNAAELLNLELKSNIRIKFYDNANR